eukprot:TRINITY_DN73354_c0_g1_i1.p1 TRINITY_DN73354_c0_g1~~TRINITY_DN73354_c0_g1_i1.p1  ORF type:complete len:221 (-),score=32.00 TRINITY_DN73354_c0_g1_i1:298-900(-)
MVFMLCSGVHNRARRSAASPLDFEMSAAEQQEWQVLSTGGQSRARRQAASPLDFEISAAEQHQWQSVQRDLQKNMYRTAYKDMASKREICVKSDFPVGYGGHVPSLRFDLLHRNTQVDREAASRQLDPLHDSLPFRAPQPARSRSNGDACRQLPTLLRPSSTSNMTTGKGRTRSSVSFQDAQSTQTPLKTSKSCSGLRAC